MTRIIHKNHQGNPVLQYSIQLDDFDTVYDLSKMDDEILIHGKDLVEMDNMGGSSQVECYLRQHREENDNDVVNGA